MTTIQGTVGEDHNSLIARAGEWDTQTNRESFPFVESNVASIVRHEKYNKWKRINNIALLFLETPIERSKHINTICLPPPNMNFDSSRCFVTGFGQDKFGDEGTHQPILKKIEMLVVEKQRCQEMFRKTRLGQTFELHESVICAGGEAGKDVCTGDGGSPLVCPVPGNEGQYYQAGIVSWGIGCGKANVPGAYTNVAFFADWISKQL